MQQIQYMGYLDRLTVCNTKTHNIINLLFIVHNKFNKKVKTKYPEWAADLRRAILFVGSRSCGDESESIEWGSFIRSSYILAASTLAVDGPIIPSEVMVLKGPLLREE